MMCDMLCRLVVYSQERRLINMPMATSFVEYPNTLLMLDFEHSNGHI